MIISCPACDTRYAVPDTAIGMEGRTVRCAKCRHSWFQEGPALPTAPEPPAVPEQPARVEPPAIHKAAAKPAAPDLGQPAGNAAQDIALVPAPDVRDTEPDEAGLPPAPPRLRGEDDIPDIPQAAPSSYVSDLDEGPSTFAYEPPFQPRRNPARMWTIAAALFAVIALGAVGATAWYGLPSWMPFAQPVFAEEQPGLKLDFPEKRQDRRQLPNGTWFFGVNGSVTNISQDRRSVPPILVVLRDARGRIVHSAEIRPAKRVLAPGESVAIFEALVPVPKSGVKAEFGWKPA